MKTLSELFDSYCTHSPVNNEPVLMAWKKDIIKVVEERDSELLLEYTEWWNTRDTITLVHIEQFLKEQKGAENG